ncbi:MAG TPA: MFS transporter [Desulfuromonadaceae bacterium]
MEPQPPHHARQLLICCCIGLVCFFGAYMRIPVLPLFAATLGADASRVGMINAAFMLSAGLLAIPSGFLSDRLGRRPMLLGGLLLMALASFLIPISPTPLVMAIIYLLFGVGLAAFTPTMMSSIADIAPPTHLGRAYSLYTTAVYIGMTFGPAAGGLMGRAWGLGRVFLFSGGLILLAFVISWLVLVKGDTHHHAAARKSSIQRSLSTLLRNRRLLAGLIGTTGGCFGFGMFITFLPLHAAAQGLNAGHVGVVFAFQALANALLRIPFGRLSDRIDRGLMSACGLLPFATALALTGLFGGVVALSACAALLGLGMGIGFTALGALVAEVVPTEQRGLAMGLYNSCIYLGMMVSSATMGGVITAVGFRTAFMLAGGVSLFMTGLFYRLYRGAPRA